MHLDVKNLNMEEPTWDGTSFFHRRWNICSCYKNVYYPFVVPKLSFSISITTHTLTHDMQQSWSHWCCLYTYSSFSWFNNNIILMVESFSQSLSLNLMLATDWCFFRFIGLNNVSFYRKPQLSSIGTCSGLNLQVNLISYSFVYFNPCSCLYSF